MNNIESLIKFLILFNSLLIPVMKPQTLLAIMSYNEYKAKKVPPFPYLFSLQQKNQHLYYFGANHSTDPSNKQYLEIEAFWNQFLSKTDALNCIVLVEGSLRRIATSREESIINHGAEGGFITFLASHHPGIIIQCPEPPQCLIDEHLYTFFSPETISYKNSAQQLLWEIRKHKANPHLSWEKIRQSSTLDLHVVESLHKHHFKQPFTPTNEDFFYSITNPVEEYSIINEVCRKASIFRDTSIVSYIENLVKMGKNIFIVYGGTHAIMQEPAIRTIWKNNFEEITP